MWFWHKAICNRSSANHYLLFVITATCPIISLLTTPLSSFYPIVAILFLSFFPPSFCGHGTWFYRSSHVILLQFCTSSLISCNSPAVLSLLLSTNLKATIRYSKTASSYWPANGYPVGQSNPCIVLQCFHFS